MAAMAQSSGENFPPVLKELMSRISEEFGDSLEGEEGLSLEKLSEENLSVDEKWALLKSYIKNTCNVSPYEIDTPEDTEDLLDYARDDDPGIQDMLVLRINWDGYYVGYNFKKFRDKIMMDDGVFEDEDDLPVLLPTKWKHVETFLRQNVPMIQNFSVTDDMIKISVSSYSEYTGGTYDGVIQLKKVSEDECMLDITYRVYGNEEEEFEKLLIGQAMAKILAE